MFSRIAGRTEETLSKRQRGGEEEAGPKLVVNNHKDARKGGE